MFHKISMDTTLLSKPSQRTEVTEFAADPAGSPLQQLFVRSPAVISRRNAGETLIVPLRAKVGALASIYTFNATGSLLWQSLESPQGISSLIEIVQREFAANRDQAERDVKQFLNDTLSVGLVEICQEVSMAAINSTVQGELRSSASH
jgi:hypothetical protein